MMRRCYNPVDAAYKNYGGRGITVYEPWHNLKQFVADIGHLHRKGLEIDRENNDGNYEPNNIRFVTHQVNADNRRSARRYTHNNETHSIAGWSRIKGLSYHLLWGRLTNDRWDIAKALNTPCRPMKPRHSPQ